MSAYGGANISSREENTAQPMRLGVKWRAAVGDDENYVYAIAR